MSKVLCGSWECRQLGMSEDSGGLSDWSRLFDVNVFGVQRMNRAVLPQMRERNSGLVLHVSSLLGRTTLPFYGPYSASKWALEALAEGYRVELSSLGIDVCVVEPGGYPTSFMDALLTPSDDARDKAYGDLASGPQRMSESFQAILSSVPAQNPQNVADKIAELVGLTRGQRPFRNVVDAMGWGDIVAKVNADHGSATARLYAAFGLSHMLSDRQ